MIVLRPRQKIMIEACRAALRKYTRVLLQAPCGFGKTVLGSFIAQNSALKGRRVMFLTHREELAKQASRTFKMFGIDHGFIYSAFTPARHKLVQIAMIDTLRNRLKQVDIPDVLIVDECHHAASRTWEMIINHFHSQGCRVVGLSATPERLDGRPLDHLFDFMIPGPTPRELIEEGNLSDFVYYAPPQVADLDGLKKKFGDFDKKEMGQRMDKPLVFGDAIEHYKRIMGGKRAIAFHVNVDGSRHFVAQCVEAGIPALHVDGEMPPKERAAAIRSFEDGYTWILSNCSLFGEGFDVRACDGVILLRRTASLSLFIQMCGRALRPHDSKEKAYILDHVGNIGIHGLPDFAHEWTLEGRKKRTSKKNNDEAVPMKQCPKCFHVHEPAPECPLCGHVYRARAEMVKVDAELQEITREQREEMAAKEAQEKALRRNAQAAAKTVDEMVERLGMKRKQAEAIVAAREEKAALRDGLRADLMAWYRDTGQAPLPTFGVAMSDIGTMKPKALKELRAKFDTHRAAQVNNNFQRTGETVDF